MLQFLPTGTAVFPSRKLLIQWRTSERWNISVSKQYRPVSRLLNLKKHYLSLFCEGALFVVSCGWNAAQHQRRPECRGECPEGRRESICPRRNRSCPHDPQESTGTSWTAPPSGEAWDKILLDLSRGFAKMLSLFPSSSWVRVTFTRPVSWTCWRCWSWPVKLYSCWKKSAVGFLLVPDLSWSPLTYRRNVSSWLALCQNFTPSGTNGSRHQ